MKRLYTGPGILALALLMALAASFAAAPEAHAAAPTFQAFSAIAAAASGGADPTVTLPAHAADDILLLATIVRSGTATVATPSGWTQIGSPTVRGTTATYQFFWKRAASSSETNPLIDRTGTTGDVFAAVITYRGATTTGDPWQVKGTVATGAVDPAVITGITTLSADSLVVVAVPGEDNNNGGITTTGTDPSAYTEHYVESTAGGDGAITFSEAARTTAGATGNVSVNWDVNFPVGWGGIVLALIPTPPPPPPAPPGGPFSYRKSITIDRTLVGNSGAPTTLTNFPFLYNVTDANLKTVANGGHVSDLSSLSVDAVSSGSAGASSSSLTISNHTTSGSNRLMLVGISISNDGPDIPSITNHQITSVTYNGVSLTEVCQATTATLNDARVWIYRLINPPAVTANVVITMDLPVETDGSIIAGVTTFTGVDQTTPLGTCVKDESDGAPHEVTVTSATGELVFDVFAVEDDSLVMAGSPAGRTQRWNLTNNTNGGGGSTAPGASSVTMTWNADGSPAGTHFTVAGVAIKPVGGVASVAIDDTSSNVGTTTIDVTHVVSGTNRLMLVGVSGLGSTPTVTSVTWDFGGSNPVNFVADLVGTTNAGGVTVIRIFKLVAPDTGTKTLRVVTSGGNNSVGVMSFTGVDQTTPLGTFAANQSTGAANATVNVTSAVGELVFDTVAVEDEGATLAAHGSQTQQWQLDSGTHGGGGSTEPGAATVTMSWVHPTAQWSIGGVSIKPAGGAVDTVGDDIIFRAVDATTCNDGQDVCTLDHEIEKYDPATGALVAWVRIPVLNTISASSDTVIYIYYGNGDITTPTENPTGVWDSNFIGVWHLKETAGGAGAIKDSTSNANHMTDSGGPTLDKIGNINGGIEFLGTDDKLERAAAVVAAYPLTMCAWFHSAVADPTADTTIVSIGDTATDNDYWTLDLRGTNLNEVRFISSTGGTGATAQTTTFVSAAGWYYGCGVGTSATNRVAYLNAGGVGTSTSSNTPAGLDTTGIGVRATATRSKFYEGMLDEVRISNTDRSAHWIKAEYNNMCACVTFATTGTEDDDPPSAVKLRGARAVSYEGAYAQTVQLKWRTSHEVDNLGFHVYREQAGQLLRVTPSMVAGSALFARGRTQLTAGQRYSWWDVLPADSGPLQYWLEEVDTHGVRTWHGPIAVSSAKGRRDVAKPEQVRSVLLSKLGRGKHKGRLPGAPWQGAADAMTPTTTAARLAVQAQLAAGPAIKLGVSAEGWYRVDQPTLIAAGLDPKVDPRRLQLFADGREVPMLVTGAKDGRLEPRDTIEFYGLGLETPWTDTRTYWLVEGPQAGQRMAGSQWKGRAEAGPASFPYTVTWQPRDGYWTMFRNGDADNFFGPVVGNWPTEQAFTLNHLDPTPPGAARLDVTLQGVTDGAHVVDVHVNGTSVGTVTFDGQAQGRAELSVPSSQLQAGANLVTLIALGGEMDISAVVTVRLTYWHTYMAEEDVLRGSVPAGQQVTIGGFSTRSISVVDVTEPDAVRAVPGQVRRQGSSFVVTVVGPGPGTRTLLAFTDRIAATPAKILANQPSRWHSAGHRADMVMIGHPTFLPSLADLKAWRERQGLKVALIDVEDLYDEFTFGAKSPWALRALMETARTSWAQAPRFLLLGGDASFDPRDTQLMGETDFVPTKLIDTDMMETASDDWFGDLDGDGVAEVAVGRLAVRTAEEAATVVQKLIGYDQTAASRTAVLVADTPDSLDFEGASTRLAELLPSGMATQAIYRSRSDDATTRGALLSALNSGAWLVNYLGHGSVEVWRGEVFTTPDASALTNGLRLPFVSTMTCLNGFFHDVWSESLAEALQRAPQGGAIGVWASSSLSQAAEQISMNRRLLQGLSAGLTLGEAVAQAKAIARNGDVRRTWILFGDPTTRLK